jgi:hypothetical protein
MKRSSFAGLLSAVVLVSTAVPSLSEALGSNPLPDGRSIVRVMALHDGASLPRQTAWEGTSLVAQADIDDRGRDADAGNGFGHHSPRPSQPHAPRNDGFDPALHLAAKLAAAETYVGITSSQLDAWRTYAVALIDLVDRPGPERSPDGPRRERPDAPRGERPEGPPQAQPPHGQPADAPLFAEKLAAQAIERGEKAGTLKAAIAALRTTLAAEQIARLREAERSFLPQRAPGGPDGFAPHDRRHGDFPAPTPQ